MKYAWISLPAADIRIQLPLGLFDKEVKILFLNEEVIDNTIKQLENAKKQFAEEEGL